MKLSRSKCAFSWLFEPRSDGKPYTLAELLGEETNQTSTKETEKMKTHPWLTTSACNILNPPENRMKHVAKAVKAIAITVSVIMAGAIIVAFCYGAIWLAMLWASMEKWN